MFSREPGCSLLVPTGRFVSHAAARLRSAAARCSPRAAEPRSHFAPLRICPSAADTSCRSVGLCLVPFICICLAYAKYHAVVTKDEVAVPAKTKEVMAAAEVAPEAPKDVEAAAV